MTAYDYQLRDIVCALSRHTQRATYAAVGGLVGRLARSVMSGQAKSPDNSWVVSVKTGLPTGYEADEVHPKLQFIDEVISTPEDLAAWLRMHS